MLRRCFDEKYHEKHPTYKNCTVADEWLLFSNFRSWMEKQDWVGNDLDKDILKQGNKVYSPDTCIFVSHEVNALLVGNSARRGAYSQGVYFDKPRNKFRAQCRAGGNPKNLGCFSTPEEAETVYRNFKSAYIIEVANLQLDATLKNALLLHAKRLIDLNQ